MKQIFKHIIIIIWAIPTFSIAQEPDPSILIESIIEGQIQNLEEGTDVGLIIEDLQELAENPLNINNASESELSRLYILNDIQINKLLQYLDNYGPAYSIFELKTIDGFTPELLTQIEPFIWFGPAEKEPQKLSDAIKYGRHQAMLRGLGTLQKAKGYLPRDDGTIPYAGNQYRYYTRYRFDVKDRFSTGFVAEKDPGEAFFKAPNKSGFDFYSGHISFKLNSIIENIIIGDFLVRSGQGLVLWQEYSLGKSDNISDISKTNRGIRPFTSVEENLFFRGIATSLKFGNSRLSVFYSDKRDDANVISGDTISSYFTSLQTSGYHRTQHEIEDKNAVRSQNAGAILSHTFNHLKTGMTFSYQHFNMPFIRSPQLYNQYLFRGTGNITAGIDYLYNKGNYQLFGEAAASKSKGLAFLQGAVARLNDQLVFSMLLRHFDKNYQAYWSNSFTEGTSTNNETGMYLGLKILPVKYVTITSYSDHYRSEWINYSTAGPSKGWDFLAQANFDFSSRFNFYIRLKNEEKDQKFTVKERYENLPERLQKARLHIQFKPGETITLKIRFEHALYEGIERENGFMVFQDIQLSPQKIPVDLSTRLAWFNTDSYNSRIYAYENDLLYTFSIPAYFGEGFRIYLNFKYKITQKLDFWMKIANTSWNDREIISSGYNEISGNNKTELKFQLRLKI